ncbi:conserved hypothetical protein [Nocardia seriolae]|nr:conserved hypothetical protein [Nocardia seriolae]
MLTREREYTTRPEALSRLRADLEAVRRQLDRLHRRFPALAQPPESLAS